MDLDSKSKWKLEQRRQFLRNTFCFYSSDVIKLWFPVCCTLTPPEGLIPPGYNSQSGTSSMASTTSEDLIIIWRTCLYLEREDRESHFRLDQWIKLEGRFILLWYQYDFMFEIGNVVHTAFPWVMITLYLQMKYMWPKVTSLVRVRYAQHLHWGACACAFVARISREYDARTRRYYLWSQLYDQAGNGARTFSWKISIITCTFRRDNVT
jgi:hypothetical protein